MAETTDRWTFWDYWAFWFCTNISILAYMLPATLMGMHISVWEAVLLILLGNLLAALPLVLNGLPGARYGLSFPEQLAVHFGRQGAVLAGVLRVGYSLGWFAILTALGGTVLLSLVQELWPAVESVPDILPKTMGIGLVPFLCMAAFLLLEILVLRRDMEFLKSMLRYGAPLLIVGCVLLACWALSFGDTGQFYRHTPKFNNWLDITKYFIPLMFMMGALRLPMAMNFSDFSQLARSERDFQVGQWVGFPLSMAFVALVSITVTSVLKDMHMETLWNPIDVIERFNLPLVPLVAWVLLLFSSVISNVTCHGVVLKTTISSWFPQQSQSRVVTLIGLFTLLLAPWQWLGQLKILAAYVNFLAPVAGVMACDFLLVRQGKIEGDYGNLNIRALVAVLVGLVPAVLMAIKAVPELTAFTPYLWFGGFLLAGIVYAMLTAIGRKPASS